MFLIPILDEMSALYEAVATNDLEAVKACLATPEGKAKLNQAGGEGDTPLIKAVRLRNNGILEALVAAGANVNLGSDEMGSTKGYTPLHFACREGDLDAINILVKAKADVNRQSADGWAPLHSAAFSGKRQAISLLIEKGAKLDVYTDQGVTPLVYVAAKGMVPSLREMLLKKPSFIVKDSQGDSLMHHVFQYQMQKMFEGEYDLPECQYDVGVVLAVAGAPLDDKNHEGKTAFEYLDEEMPAYHNVLRIVSHNAEKFQKSKTEWNYMTLKAARIELLVGMGLELKHAVDLAENCKLMEDQRQLELKRKEDERPAGGCPVMRGGRKKKAFSKDMEIPKDGSDPSNGQCPFFQKKKEGSKVEEIDEEKPAKASTPAKPGTGHGEATMVDTPHGKMEIPADGSDPSKGQCPFFQMKAKREAQEKAAAAAAATTNTSTVPKSVELPTSNSPSKQAQVVVTKEHPPTLFAIVYENRTFVMALVIAFFMGIWFEQLIAPMRSRA